MLVDKALQSTPQGTYRAPGMELNSIRLSSSPKSGVTINFPILVSLLTESIKGTISLVQMPVTINLKSRGLRLTAFCGIYFSHYLKERAQRMNNQRGGCFRKGMEMLPRGVRWARKSMILKFGLFFKKASPLGSRTPKKFPTVWREKQRLRTGQKIPIPETQHSWPAQARPFRAKWGWAQERAVGQQEEDLCGNWGVGLWGQRRWEKYRGRLLLTATFNRHLTFL